MNVIIKIAVLLYLLWLLYAIARREYGAKVVAARRRKVDMLLRDGMLAESDDRHRVGISEVIFGRLSMEELEERLSVDYPYVELIWVVDLTRQKDAEELLSRYNTIPMDLRTCEGLPCRGVRRIYRSRSRRYKRLVIIDSESPSVADGFNCAVEAASYDLILPMESRLRPLRSVLRVLAEAYGARESYHPDWVMALALRTDGRRRSAKAFVEAMATGDRWGGWRGRSEVEGLYLFRREAIIAVGGFADVADCCCEIVARLHLRRMREEGRVVRHGPMRHSPYSHGPVLRDLFPSVLQNFAPVVVAHVDADSPRTVGHRDLLTGRHYPPTWILGVADVVLWGLVVAALCVGEIVGAITLAALMVVARIW